MQARKAGAAMDEACNHSEDQRKSGEAVESKVPKHSDLLRLGSQYSTSAKKGWESEDVPGLSGSEPS
jgi:hypothetical protein